MASIIDWIIVLQHSIISFTGIIGNLLVIIVYKNKVNNKQTITLFIIHLAVTDLACCLFVIPINCYHELHYGDISSDFMCKLHTFLNVINITYSCVLMVLVAFERCFSIMFPFKIIFIKLRAKVIMAFLLFACFLIALVCCLGVGIFHKVLKVSCTNTTNTPVEVTANPMHYYSTNNFTAGEKARANSVDKESLLKSKNFSIFQHKTDMYNLEQRSYSNVTISWMATDHCFPDDRLISIFNFHYIQLIQNAMIVICFVILFIIYAFICILVMKRRQLKINRDNYYKKIIFRFKLNNMAMNEIVQTREKTDVKKDLLSTHSSPCHLISSISLEEKVKSTNLFSGCDEGTNEIRNKATQTKFVELDANEKKKKCLQKLKPTTSKANFKSALLANIKTAFMLFVVTLIMAIVYAPALLTSLGYMKYNPLYWNLIYINNAINPVVYSFFNPSFRGSLEKTFHKLYKRSFSIN